MLSGKMVDGVLTLMIVHASGEAWHELTDGPNAETYLKNTAWPRPRPHLGHHELLDLAQRASPPSSPCCTPLPIVPA